MEKISLTPIKVTLLILCTMLLSVALLFAVPMKQAQAANGTLQVGCDYVTSAVADPIRPESDHLHQEYGSLAPFTDTTTFADISSAGTACANSFTKVMYWQPHVYEEAGTAGETELLADNLTNYYRDFGGDTVNIKPIPPNSKMVGGINFNGAGANSKIIYQCGTNNVTYNGLNGCSNASGWRITIRYPNCYNGGPADSPNSYRYSDNNCTDTPAGYTQEIVGLHSTHKFPQPPDGAVTLPLEVSTGIGTQGPLNTNIHADRMANDTASFIAHERGCVIKDGPEGGPVPADGCTFAGGFGS